MSEIVCTSKEGCCHPEMCVEERLCLGSDEGIAHQERVMKAFFERLLPQYVEFKG